MAVLSTLNSAKYTEHTTNLSNKRRRLAEVSEKDLVKINYNVMQWLLGAVSGNATIQTAALTELESIYDDTITPPDNLVTSTVTESTTRRGTGISLSAGDNTVTFSSAMPAATYSLTYNTYTASGGQVQWTQDPATRTVNGFEIWVASACKIDYIALYN
jgi:hypothetical protein